MNPRLASPSIQAHCASLRRCFSSSSPHPHHDPKLTFLYNEVEGLQSLTPRHPQPDPEPWPLQEKDGRTVQISHPWLEWVALMERLLEKGYLDRTVFQTSSSSWFNSSRESNLVRRACLNFARDRYDVIRYLSRRDIQIMVRFGCPSLDRKVVNSGKRLRAYVGIEEGDVCSSCNLRGNCERAYVKAHKDEGGRTVDMMRLLLTYGLDLITGAVENKACLNKSVEEPIRRLLKEMVELSAKELDSSAPLVTSGRPLSRLGNLSGQQMQKTKIDVPMKQGDWICPKCNFLNFAKNIKCLRCDGEFQERLKKLREEHEHLPLKRGDWICEKCNFLNFAKNAKCLRCNENPSNRQLNPGEWECVSCNYINFQRNMICLKCDWKRPKASINGKVIPGSEHRNVPRYSTVTFVSNDENTNMLQFSQHKSPMQEKRENFWRSLEVAGIGYSGPLKNIAGFTDFPIVGGKSAISQDSNARDRWKLEMLNRNRDVLQDRTKETDIALASFTENTEIDESTSEDDDIAGWFRYESSQDSEKLKGCKF